VTVGSAGLPLDAALDPGATAAWIGLLDGTDHWILPAGVPDVETPKYPSAHAKVSISDNATLGPRAFAVTAVDSNGNPGPIAMFPVMFVRAPAPEAPLVISLQWDTEADLDLRVLDPTGVEIWKRNINSWQPPPPGTPVDPTAWQTGGVLDVDSNAACVIDGRRVENVLWKKDYPKGRYTVRVDTASLCSADAARWTVFATKTLEDKTTVTLATAAGVSGPEDASLPHDAGAGVTALTFLVE
jgi:hypothetical protein